MKRAQMKLHIILEYPEGYRESAAVILRNLSKVGQKMGEVAQQAMTELPLEGAGYITAEGDKNAEVVIETVF